MGRNIVAGLDCAPPGMCSIVNGAVAMGENGVSK